MNEFKTCTLWYRKNQTGEFEFNHLQDGHALCMKPEPNPSFKLQQAWVGASWHKYHAWLDNSMPPKVVHFDVLDALEQSK